MKVIHSYSSNEIIWKEPFYVLLLSALYAKKHYGNINLYCSSIQKEQLSQINPIYDSIKDVLDNNYSIYSYGKLLTYLDQSEPFLHLDHDSVIFNKINFDKIKSPIVFSHPDIKKLTSRLGELSYHLPLLYSKKDTDYNYLRQAYLDLFDSVNVPESILGNLDFSSIPNMNVVYVNDTARFTSAVKNSILHYNANKEKIDSHPFGAHHVEQLMIHQFLLSDFPEYKKAVKKGNTFLQNKVPLSISFKDQQRLSASISDTSFPFKFKATVKCQCCEDISQKKYKLTKPEDIKNIFGLHFNNFTHFSFLQWYQIWQTFIINEIVEQFGEEHIISAHNYFKDYYSKSNLPLISEGELLYEKITGNKLFSK